MKKEEKDYKMLYEEMGKEITQLKRTVAGQKGRLQQLSKKIQQTESDVKEKEMTIAGLQSQVKNLSEKLSESKQNEQRSYDALEKYRSLPWYKRIFAK